jgi:hypothetical protein
MPKPFRQYSLISGIFRKTLCTIVWLSTSCLCWQNFNLISQTGSEMCHLECFSKSWCHIFQTLTSKVIEEIFEFRKLSATTSMGFHRGIQKTKRDVNPFINKGDNDHFRICSYVTSGLKKKIRFTFKNKFPTTYEVSKFQKKYICFSFGCLLCWIIEKKK